MSLYNAGSYTRVKGLKKLRRSLIKADDSYKKEFREIFKSTAEIVARDARRRTPIRTGTARKSIKAATSGAGAAIRAGANKGARRSRAPYFGWLDFGGRIKPRGTTISRDLVPSPGKQYDGRYVYPAIRAKMGAALDHLERKIVEVLNRF